MKKIVWLAGLAGALLLSGCHTVRHRPAPHAVIVPPPPHIILSPHAVPVKHKHKRHKKHDRGHD